MKFKIGDKVRIIDDDNNHSNPLIGEETTIIKIDESKKKYPYSLAICGNNFGTRFGGHELELITNNKNNMNILEQIKLARKSEPEKTLVKAGLMNMDESLTEEGKQVLQDILIQEYKTKMKTIADIIIAEKEKENKN